MNDKLLEQLIDEIPIETKVFVSIYEAITMRIYQILESKEMTQKDLADLLEKRPSEISKWLNDGHNLTLKTIAKIESVLDESIIKIPVPSARDFNVDKGPVKGKVSFVVHRNHASKRLSEVDSTRFTPHISIRKKIA